MAVKEGGRRLVIVESPTKATKIASFLGDGYIVESSRGHVRDLPTGAAEVPAKYKGEKWARTGVDVDNGFEALYVVNPDKRATLRSLKDALAKSDELLLATDGDREGEAIAWHLLQELKPKVPARRMVFHEITQSAIAEAVANPRDLDSDLVDAQETRRILDRLYGYEVSPVLWKKVMPRLSAGRVQSVATRLVVDRERERMAFRAASFWDLDAVLDAGEKAEPPLFPARLTRVGERRVAQGRDFDSRGRLVAKGSEPLLHLDQAQAEDLAATLRTAGYAVRSVESKPVHPPPVRAVPDHDHAAGGRPQARLHRPAGDVGGPGPLRGRLHHLHADRLGHPLRHRDHRRAQPGAAAVRRRLPARPAAGLHLQGQERPGGARGDPAGGRDLPDPGADPADRRPVPALRADLDAHHRLPDEGRRGPLHHGDHRRHAASSGEACTFVASGRTITFYGFLKAYVESFDDADQAADDAQTRLPNLVEGQTLRPESVTASGHETRPPARYTEPSLVAKLEELEIGRPSTYASILRTITVAGLRLQEAARRWCRPGWPSRSPGCWRSTSPSWSTTPSPRRWRRCWTRSPAATPSGSRC